MQPHVTEGENGKQNEHNDSIDSDNQKLALNTIVSSALEAVEEHLEDSICQRLSIAQNNKKGIKDIYETVPVFSGIHSKRDREDLKKALIQEEFIVGDVLFDY